MNRLGLFLGISLAVTCCRQVQADDWYRFRGPGLDGISTETAWDASWPASGLPVAWKAAVGTGFSAVSVSEGRVYTLGNADNIDTVFCLDEISGKTLWKHSYPSPTDPYEFEGGPTSTPTVDGDAVYTLGRRGDLFCLDKATGQVRWAINVADAADVRIPAWGFAGSPLAWDEKLILNVGDAGVAVDKSTGKLIWSSADKDAGYASPVPGPSPGPAGPESPNRTVVIGSARFYVCVDVDTGEERWRQRWLTTFGCNAADAIVSDNQVFLSSAYNRGSALLSISAPDEQPTVLWKHKDMQNHLGSSVLIDGYLYGIHGDLADGADIRCIEWSSGEVQWTSEDLRAGAISATSDQLIILSDSGELAIASASPAGWDVKHRQNVLEGICWTAPVLSNGRLYCRSADGTLVCLDVP